MKWITNLKADNEVMINDYRIKGMVINRPHATKWCTTEYLESIDYIGVYDPNQPYSEPDFDLWFPYIKWYSRPWIGHIMSVQPMQPIVPQRVEGQTVRHFPKTAAPTKRRRWVGGRYIYEDV